MEKSHWVELFKYPITIITAMAALIATSSAINIDSFKLGASGFELKTVRNEAREGVSSLSERVVLLESRYSELKRTRSVELADAVSDKDVPALAKINPNQTNTGKGYIWIGDHRNSDWGDTKIELSDPERKLKPEDLPRYRDYKLTGNLYLRDGKPDQNLKNRDYFSSIKNLGVVVAGTKVKFLSAPIAYDRTTTNQYWVEVQVVQ